MTTAIGCALSVCTIACGSSTAPDKTQPATDRYDFTLHKDSATSYAVPQCRVNGQLYCMGWVPSSGDYTLSMDRAVEPLAAVFAGDTLDLYLGQFNLDSVPFTFLNVKAACLSLTLRLAGTADALRGTWSRSVDCHGAAEVGDLVGAHE
jgi:hypothetical protein